MTATTWTLRMIESLATVAERKWKRLHAAQTEGARKHWERAYNRTMFAVKYLQGRLETN